MINISTYLIFNGQAAEALEFYKNVFGGELNTMTHGQMGNTERPDWIMHGQLSTPFGWDLMGSDHPNEEAPTKVGNTQAVIWGDDTERMTEMFNALSEGGTIQTPLAAQVWGALYGDFTDKFGIFWAFNVEGSGGANPNAEA